MAKRKLTAILAADVVGYSRLVGADEDGALSRLRVLRIELWDPTVELNKGRVVKRLGDGLLLEFRSVVDAVNCALDLQSGMAERNAGLPADRRMDLRIGIHIGDVVEEADGDLMGDGVNVAARLEAISEPGGICLSNDAYRQVRGKVAPDFEDMGLRQLKNIAEPLQAWRALIAGRSSEVDPVNNAGEPAIGNASTQRLSLLVLPFSNIGGDAEYEYFVDGVTESLTTDLSRIAGAIVIARNTAFTFKGKAVDVKKLGRELNVRYVLEGSVQRGGARLRINVQLIDAETGNHLWAERFDKPVADLFDMQDEIVARLANALDAELVAAEARRAESMLRPEAVDLVFQGRAWLNKGLTPDYMSRAQSYFEKAVELDSRNVEALVGLAHVHWSLGAAIMTDEWSAHFEMAEATISRAVSLAPKHASAHYTLGAVLVFTRRAVLGIAEAERALTLDQNLARAHALIGYAKYLLGRGAETEAHIDEAFRLSPRDTLAPRWWSWIGLAKAQCGADEEAEKWIRRSLEANPNYSVRYFDLAAVLSRLGKSDEARIAVQAGLKLDPHFTIRRYRDIAYASSDDPVYRAGRDRLIEGMFKAETPGG
ncbi:MAG: adenylate/guanylate cyclase domain-containing protein [Beijerinckiaceae bacterium]